MGCFGIGSRKGTVEPSRIVFVVVISVNPCGTSIRRRRRRKNSGKFANIERLLDGRDVEKAKHRGCHEDRACPTRASQSLVTKYLMERIGRFDEQRLTGR